MTVTLFGHKNTPDTLKQTIRSVVEELILNRNADLFYIGNNGAFDRMAADVLLSLSKKYTHIKFFIVIAYLNDTKISFSEHTIYPEGLETVPKHLAILKRNYWMINKADTVITYVTNTFTNSYKLMTYAQNHGKRIINLNDI